MSLPNQVGLPAWAQTLLWAKWPTRALDYFATNLGEPFTIRLLGDRTYVLVSHPDAVRQVFTAFPEAGNEELRPFLGSNSLFLLHGERHGVHRRLLQPPFLMEAAKAYAGRIQTLMHKALSAFSPGEVVCINRLAQTVTIEIITDALFGIEDPSAAAEMRSLLFQMTNLISGPAMFFEVLRKDWGPLSPGHKIRKQLHAIDQAIRRQVRSGGSSSQSVVGKLLQPAGEQRLTEDELVDEIKTLLGAGQDPTAAAFAWAIYWIHEHPAVHDRVTSELKGRATHTPDAAALGSDTASYLDLICRETLRILPIVPATDRYVREQTNFMGHALEPGTRIVACSYLTHRRKEIFENPEAFLPERFLGKKYSPFEYYPFGGGHRRCVGAHFAFLQMKVMLGTLLSSVSFERPRSSPPTIQTRGVTLSPARNLRLKVERVVR